METNDKRKDFIDDDIFEGNIEEKINELYNKTRKIAKINKNTPETDNEILKKINECFSEFGIWDTTINSFSETDFYLTLENEKNNNNEMNPFNRKYIRNIIATQFDAYIDNDKELVANMILMTNRMSKIPEMVMSKIGWNEEKKSNFKKILMKCKENGYDYSNNDLNKSIYEKVNNNFNVNYDEFELYSKLDYCKNMFYKIKHNKINQGIEKGYVQNYTNFDVNDSNNLKLIRIDVPGYIHPYIAHVEKDDYMKNTGENIDEQKMERCDERFPYFPMINFKMNKEQMEYIKKLKEDKVYFADMPSFKYLLDSVKQFEYQELKEERRRKKLGNKEEGITPKGTKRISEKTQKAKEELDNKMYAHLLKICESVTDSERLEEYRQKMEEQKDNETRYNTNTYNRIQKYVEFINEKENKNYSLEQKENEIANIYVYMKMCDMYFRSCQRDKDNTGYMKTAYDSYQEGFDKFKEDVKKGKSIEDIKNNVNHTKKAIRKPKVIESKQEATKEQVQKDARKAKRPYTRKITGNRPIHEYSNKELAEKNVEMSNKIDKLDTEIQYNSERADLLEQHIRLKKELQEKQAQLDEITKRIWELEEKYAKNTKEERNK